MFVHLRNAVYGLPWLCLRLDQKSLLKKSEGMVNQFNKARVSTYFIVDSIPTALPQTMVRSTYHLPKLSPESSRTNTTTPPGRSRMQSKSPEQLELLQQSWEEDPFPETGEKILLVYETGLSKAQVNAWFVNERKKAEKKGEDLTTRNHDNNSNAARKMWVAYTKDPEGYVKGLTSGRIHPATGAEKDMDEADEEDN